VQSQLAPLSLSFGVLLLWVNNRHRHPKSTDIIQPWLQSLPGQYSFPTLVNSVLIATMLSGGGVHWEGMREHCQMYASNFWALSTMFEHLAMPIFETVPAFACVYSISEWENWECYFSCEHVKLMMTTTSKHYPGPCKLVIDALPRNAGLTVRKVSRWEGSNPSSLPVQDDCSGRVRTAWPISFVSSQRTCYHRSRHN